MKPHKEKIIGFNQIQRDNWVKSIARKTKKKARVLDVGAGQCPYRPFFSHCIYTSHDFYQYKGKGNSLGYDDWEYGNIDIVSDITAIPIKNRSIDVILCTEVLEHVPDPISALREFTRLLKKNGKIYITVPLASGIHQIPYHYYGGFTPYFFRKYLKEYGFSHIKITANGGFFRHLLQELHRAAWIFKNRKKNIFWYIKYWIVIIPLVILTKLASESLTELDDAISIRDFTVGYFIEAQKNK